MTAAQRKQMIERKRAGYTRRLREIREKYDMPALTNVQREKLLDLIMQVNGDAIVDIDLRALHRLASRGLV